MCLTCAVFSKIGSDVRSVIALWSVTTNARHEEQADADSNRLSSERLESNLRDKRVVVNLVTCPAELQLDR